MFVEITNKLRHSYLFQKSLHSRKEAILGRFFFFAFPLTSLSIRAEIIMTFIMLWTLSFVFGESESVSHSLVPYSL